MRARRSRATSAAAPGYWNIIEAVQARREGGDETDRDRAVEAEAPRRARAWAQSIPRKEDRRLVQGQGVFVDDIKRHNMGYVHFVRSPYAHARIISIDVCAALEAPGVIRHAHRRRGRDPDRSVLPALAAARRADQGLRPRGRPRALRRRPRGRGRRRDARARARRGRAGRGRVRAARRRRRRPHARSTRAAGAARRGRHNLVWEGVYEWGDVDARIRRGRPDRDDLRAPLRPLQLDAARVRRRARRVQPRHRAVDDPLQQPVPRLRARS